MNIKNVAKLFFVLGLTVVSLQAYAHQGKGYRIISEKVEMSPGAIGGLIELDSKSNGDTRKYAEVMTSAPDKTMDRNESVYVEGYHTMSIRNTTQQTQLYKYVMEVNCGNRSFRNIKHIELYPQGTFTNSSSSYLVVQENRPGTYKINAITEIVGESSGAQRATGKLVVK